MSFAGIVVAGFIAIMCIDRSVVLPSDYIINDDSEHYCKTIFQNKVSCIDVKIIHKSIERGNGRILVAGTNRARRNFNCVSETC